MNRFPHPHPHPLVTELRTYRAERREDTLSWGKKAACLLLSAVTSWLAVLALWMTL